MANLVTNIGEELITEVDLTTITAIVGLYNNSTDALGEGSTLSSITTEPTGSAYARQSSGVSIFSSSGTLGIQTDSTLTFDVSDSSQTVDHHFLVVNFQSDTVAGDASATDHLIGIDDLSQSRDLSQVDTVEYAAGDFELQID